MANHILLVFEGAKAEERVFSSLNNFYINEDDNTILIAVYGTTIYTLYKEVKEDAYLDLFTLLKEKPKNKLSDISRNDVSEIYLFFDYDGHASNASDQKIKEMLEFFTEETDHGKLYLSYPMLEALKHLKNDIPFQTVVAESNQDYKKLVNKSCDKCYINIPKLTQENWSYILSEHWKKMNYLIFNTFSLPQDLITQITVFKSQKEKHIDPYNQVAVLSAFPAFIIDYYGTTKIQYLLDRT